ncbi:MAG: TetR/AcrR family transcriptional regulator [Myxococcota bacterium]|jgi:AcrR family transcriptional regulator|nr:TetR/AcrR family transcriptional regulator [Myxococcota bacterium]
MTAADLSHRPLETVCAPKQARAERTLHRLLDAAEALIEEKGLAGLSIPDIVRQARSSVGGFYARFRDKNELLRALEERFFQQQRERALRLMRRETWGGAPIQDVVRGCMRELVGVFRQRRALIRAFVGRAVQDAQFRGAALAFEHEVAELAGGLLLAAPGVVRHPNPPLAIRLAVAIVFGSMIASTLFGDVRQDFAQLDDDSVADELARNFLGYLSLDEAFGRT